MRGEERWGERRRKARKTGCEGSKEREEIKEGRYTSLEYPPFLPGHLYHFLPCPPTHGNAT